LTVVRKAWPWLIASGLVLLSGAWSVAQAGSGIESFGRWQQRPKQCRVQAVEGGFTSCSSVRLDQRDASVMRLSVLMDRAGGSAALGQLTLVGVLAQDSASLICRAGECRLPAALRWEVVGASELKLDGRGLALGLPLTWAAQGSCRVDQQTIRCSAHGAGSEAWLVELTLR
jgi:hypothetical protein